MEKPKPKEGMRKFPCEVTTVRLVSFSFVPALKKLPTESTVTLGEEERQPMRRSNEYVGTLKEAAAGQTMSGDGVFKADFVYVGGDVDEGDPGNRRTRLAKETTVRQEAHSQLNLSAEHMMQGQLTPSQITAPSESTARISLNMSPAINAVMETANDKHRSTDVRGCDASFGSKVSPGLLLNQVPDKWTTLISDRGVTHSAELLETPASSRESVLSEDWFGPRVLSSEGSPASLSRTISPCSSVSLASSPCPPSPGTGRAWHRPPPTQLTLLTAILRKGRLPVLSSVQQRAYSPCWPISAVSLSSCSACNAAAKLALFCPGVARSGKAQTAIAAPQREALHMLTHGPESQCLRCLTPPPSPDLFESNTFDPPRSCAPNPACRLSPSPWTPTLSPSPSASLCTLGLLSPLPDSHSSTPDRLSLSPSPATSSRDLLTPSPSVSPSLSPSASPVPKSDSDRAGRKRKYKIKSSYKAFAAIPTNTLLLEQQAIDDKVEKEGCPLEAEADRVTETHSEMCSPAQLRQQSEELYAAIDQVLLDPLPMHRSQSAPLPSETLEDAEVPRRLTSLPRSAGRETKYAIFHLQPSGSAERNLTKPGVIRPVTVIPKLTEEEEDFPNPFRQQYLEETPEEQSQKPRHPIVTVHENEALSCSEFVRTPAGQTAQLAEDRRAAGSPTFRKGDVRRTDEMVLLITEKEVTSTPPVAEGSSKLGPASFNTARVKTEVRETHI
ncbi:hypothetical protein ANANG_G00301080 [Anguilla anguilla]|uniref:Muscular LMNA-interacting protein n=1 Tax=Anguilla anguilla TaxID=7936 RepID=A0A9D3RI72_ANGAN|nr:hypothetical protein ANANG_G00301080 [Anguilla anguilla]